VSRTIVVTGAARGIGRAVTARFVAAGDHVVAVGRDAALAPATGTITPVQCDVTDEAAVAACFAELDVLDVLVNNAGMGESAPLARTTLESWERQIAVNATGAFLCTRAALPRLRERGWGRIVTVASTAGRAGTAYTAAYSASKHAAVGLMRSVAAELAGSGVTANAVCPTFVDTDMTTTAVERISATTGRDAAASRAMLAGTSPLGRLLEPEEVAAAVAWLASDEARAVNGQAIVLDGGGIQA
jgi:NAD(P)-dependent dehydrogenase (short-subunit alcohol dehydrogenase family)